MPAREATTMMAFTQTNINSDGDGSHGCSEAPGSVDIDADGGLLITGYIGARGWLAH